jgi:hypothetical protein
MSLSGDYEPPNQIEYDLDEALELLAALEDARDALIVSGRLLVVVIVEQAVQRLSRKLQFRDDGEPDGQ